MATHERSQETTASPNTVWKIWSDTTTWADWNPDVRSVSLDGPFQNDATGTMTTGAGTHKIRLEEIQPGRSFDLVTSPVPATTFRFHCEVTPTQVGSRISQSVRMSGLLGPIFSLMMGKRIAESFRPILAGLAKAAEKS